MPSKNKITDEMLVEAVKNSYNFSEVLRAVSSGRSGSMHKHLKNRIERLGLDTSHFCRMPRNEIQRNNWREVLVKTDRRRSRCSLLRAMMIYGFEYRCYGEDCPNPTPEWRGKPLTLEIEHIDGDGTNNEPSNLCFLCPNCHAQTASNNRSRAVIPDPRWVATAQRAENGSKPTKRAARSSNNKQRTKREFKVYPPAEEVAAQVAATSYRAVARTLGTSDNAVRKYLKKNGLEVRKHTSSSN